MPLVKERERGHASGLAKIHAHQKPVKTQAKHQNSSTKRVTDWIGGICPADSLYVWFPAHWVPRILQRLQTKQDEYRQTHIPWFDQALADEELQQQQPQAPACRSLQFGLKHCDSGITQLTCSIRVDWPSLPVDNFRQHLQNVRRGVVAGVFQAKVASPWAEVSAPRLQVSLNDSEVDQWYDTVYSLPLTWPELTAMNSAYMHQVVPYSLHELRSVFKVPGMWGKFVPNWDLLRKHLYNHGPSYYTHEELEEKLTHSKSRLPGEEIKDSVRPDSDWHSWAWEAWKTNLKLLWRVCVRMGLPSLFRMLAPFVRKCLQLHEMTR